jgi:hypothetical protein
MNSNNFGVRSYAVKEVLLTFNLLSSKRVKRINSVFRTYYVLGRRAHYYLVNPNSVFDTFGRIFILFEGIRGKRENTQSEFLVLMYDMRRLLVDLGGRYTQIFLQD